MDFTELEVWKLSHELALKIYIICKFLPEEEKYGVSSQIKRSVNSIAANIAEGHGRFHYQENIQFCRQARGSLEETRNHLLFIKSSNLLKKISSIEYLIDVCQQIKLKLNAYIAYLKKCKQSIHN